MITTILIIILILILKLTAIIILIIPTTNNKPGDADLLERLLLLTIRCLQCLMRMVSV